MIFEKMENAGANIDTATLRRSLSLNWHHEVARRTSVFNLENIHIGRGVAQSKG